jgi:hypothetical protein
VAIDADEFFFNLHRLGNLLAAITSPIFEWYWQRSLSETNHFPYVLFADFKENTTSRAHNL